MFTAGSIACHYSKWEIGQIVCYLWNYFKAPGNVGFRDTACRVTCIPVSLLVTKFATLTGVLRKIFVWLYMYSLRSQRRCREIERRENET